MTTRFVSRVAGTWPSIRNVSGSSRKEPLADSQEELAALPHEHQEAFTLLVTSAENDTSLCLRPLLRPELLLSFVSSSVSFRYRPAVSCMGGSVKEFIHPAAVQAQNIPFRMFSSLLKSCFFSGVCLKLSR